MTCDRNIRLGFLGCSGTGRTVVATELAKRLSLPLLLSRSITQPVLARDGYDYASGQQVERFLAAERREIELIDTRIKREQELGDFVSDRTIIDHFAYLLLDVDNYSDSDMKEMLAVCQKHASTYNYLFHIPWPNTKPRANGVRTVNRWYQYGVDAMIRGLCNSWNVRVFQCEADTTVDDMVKAIADWGALWR